MDSEQVKLHFSYNQIHDTIRWAAENTGLREFRPTLILAIGGGGFIPARILRTFLRKQTGENVPIQAIGLILYEQGDGCDPSVSPVRKTQWLTYHHQHGPQEAAVSLQGHRILIVDEVDDSRKTLSYAVEELLKDIAAEKQAWLAARQQSQQQLGSVGSPATPGVLSPSDSPLHDSSDDSCAATELSCAPACVNAQQAQLASTAASTADAEAGWQEPVIGVFVVHNKLKAKRAVLPADIMNSTYFAGGDIDDLWVRYPWDADDIWEHTDKAHSLTLATQHISPVPSTAAAVPVAAASVMPMVS